MLNRRNFIKNAILGGTALASINALADDISASVRKGKCRTQKFNMHGYAAPRIDDLRIGVIGLGARGFMGISRFHLFEGARTVAICDIVREKIDKIEKYLAEKKLPKAASYCGNDEEFKKLCDRDDIDLVFIATPWKWHVPMAEYAMNAGKHVAVEVPAARTLEEAWRLVEASERTKKHCFMLENCVYDFFESATINMAIDGVLGDLIHAEGAYIHKIIQALPKKETWRWEENNKSGNLYPTHGLGPVSLAMGINRGDSFDYMTSMSSDDFTWFKNAKRAKEEVPSIPLFDKYRGNINSSLIRTKKGRTIVLQHDVSSPRPYDRRHILSGTDGFVQKYPSQTIFLGGKELSKEDSSKILKKYSPETIIKIGEFAKKIGGHGGMDTIMVYRLIHCLRNGLPLDMDVYDAAAWSAVTPLSIWSVANRSAPADFPDFTAGAWQTAKPQKLS